VRVGTRPLAKRPWYEDETPGIYSQTPREALSGRFRTTFRVPRSDDLRIDAQMNANDRGVYIGDTRHYAPGDIQSKIEQARGALKSPQGSQTDGRMRGWAAPPLKGGDFRLHFKIPDSSRGLDGEVTEPISASERHVKSSEQQTGSKMFLTGIETAREAMEGWMVSSRTTSREPSHTVEFPEAWGAD